MGNWGEEATEADVHEFNRAGLRYGNLGNCQGVRGLIFEFLVGLSELFCSTFYPNSRLIRP
jgi:hypothetical protein